MEGETEGGNRGLFGRLTGEEDGRRNGDGGKDGPRGREGRGVRGVERKGRGREEDPLHTGVRRGSCFEVGLRWGGT